MHSQSIVTAWDAAHTHEFETVMLLILDSSLRVPLMPFFDGALQAGGLAGSEQAHVVCCTHSMCHWQYVKQRSGDHWLHEVGCATHLKAQLLVECCRGQRQRATVNLMHNLSADQAPLLLCWHDPSCHPMLKAACMWHCKHTDMDLLAALPVHSAPLQRLLTFVHTLAGAPAQQLGVLQAACKYTHIKWLIIMAGSTHGCVCMPGSSH